MRRRRQAGFTLSELMVSVAIIGILAAVAVFGARRPQGDYQLDQAAVGFRQTLAAARERALATHAIYLVEIAQATGFRYCTMALPRTSPPTCDTTTSTRELMPWRPVAELVEITKWGADTQINSGGATTTLGTNTARIVVFANGGIDGDPASTATNEGFTLYLRATSTDKVRKVYAYQLSGQTRVLDVW